MATLDWVARAGWRRALAILAVALVVIVPGQATLPVTDRDEARFAQASRQMLASGDLIDIRFQDQPRWKKPVGIYWLQSLAVWSTGSGAIWAYRLPSAIAMVLAALATAWAARPLVGPRGALLAGVIFATGALGVAEAHIAKTDAALALASVLALGALARLVLPPAPPAGTPAPTPLAATAAADRGAWTAALFWGAMAAAILLKGPVLPAIVALALLGLWASGTRPRVAALRPVAGLAATAALVAPWLVAIGVLSGGRFFADSLGADLGAKLGTGQEAHWGPPGLYAALVWATFWPWAALLPLAAPWVWRQRRAGWVALMLAWVVPFWLVLEAVPTKLPHYVLPLYPALAILLGGWLAAATAGPSRLAAGLVAVPGLALALACLGLPLALTGTLPWPVLPLALLGCGATLLAARAAAGGRTGAQVAASLVAACTLYPAALHLVLPSLTPVFPSPGLAALAAPWRACASGPLISVGYREPSLVFLTETGTWLAPPAEAARTLAADPNRMALVEDRLRPQFDAALGGVRVRERGHLAYFNPNRGAWEVARLLTPAEGTWAPCTPD